MPVPSRATNSQKAFWTRPVSEHDDAPQGHRDRGGDVLAGVPVGEACSRGIDPSRNRTPKAPPIAPITASDAPSDPGCQGRAPTSAALSNPSISRAQPDRHEGAGARRSDGVAQRHLLVAHARQEVVGQDDLLVERCVLGLPARLLGQHRGSEAGGVTARAVDRGIGVSRPSPARPDGRPTPARRR